VAADDDFESFRGAVADLDDDRARRIRGRFESLRATAPAPAASSEGTDDESGVVHLEPATGDEPTPARHRRPVLIGVAAAVVLLAFVGAFTLFRSSDRSTDLGSGVGDVPLDEIAARAAAKAGVDLQGSEVLYVKQIGGGVIPAYGTTARGSVVRTTESWVRRDGSGVARTTSEFVPSGPGELLGVPGPTETPLANGNGFLSKLSYDEIRSLPTTPHELIDVIANSYVSSNDSASSVGFIVSLIALDTTPPTVRAAGFEALDQLGAEPVGRVSTYAGVEGDGYQGLDSYGRPWLVVVDLASTDVLSYARAIGTGVNTYIDAQEWIEFLEEHIEDGLPN
jgi:hypothetical protein